jgi:hypothetical protein
MIAALLNPARLRRKKYEEFEQSESWKRAFVAGIDPHAKGNSWLRLSETMVHTLTLNISRLGRIIRITLGADKPAGNKSHARIPRRSRFIVGVKI